jgi:3D (Asp-Asp-Asp) domain-containing protein
MHIPKYAGALFLACLGCTSVGIYASPSDAQIPDQSYHPVIEALRAKPFPVEVSGTVTGYSPTETCQDGDIYKCITASGDRPEPGITVACPRSLNLGTIIVIDGVTYLCQDRTAEAYDGRFDIFFSSSTEAKAFGKKELLISIYGN